jgi:serine/threonine protein kinase
MRRNNYVVYDRLLGSGTFSKVYLGRDEHTGEEVAVK